MKNKFASGTKLLLAALCSAALLLGGARAEESINAKLLALFPRFDANRDAVLSAAEQASAVAAVRKQHGDYWAQQVQVLFSLAAANDGNVTQARWQEQAENYGKIRKETFRVAMRDGARLATDVYLPNGPGPFPVILMRTPYGRVQMGKGPGKNAANAGYAFVIQDARGRFDSEGENMPFVGCGWGEHRDGVETLAWIKKQTWCNGKIGTEGASAMGITQNLLAGAAPAELTAQHITVAAESLYNTTYIGGAFRQADIENWTGNNKFDPHALELERTHLCYDDYWRALDTTTKFSAMNIPAMHVGGWFDMFAQATLNEFVGRQHAGAPGGRGKQKLVIGPWTHSVGKMPVGELSFPHSRPPEQYSQLRWFEQQLKGVNNGILEEPAVAYYVMGDTAIAGAPGNEWRYANDWPVLATATPFYFSRDGRLGTGQPAEADAHVEYTFDPAQPCPTVGGNNLTLARGPMNQNKIEHRDDVVLFTTAPLEAPLEITGRVQAKMFVASSAADSDLSVRLCDVYPDGKSYLIAEGMLRLRYRKSFEKTEPLTPGQIEAVTVDCWSTSIVFNKGHCLRATVTSSNYPRFDLNPGTGQPWSDAGAKVKQTNRIWCDAAHPSHLLLPVVAPKTSTAAR